MLLALSKVALLSFAGAVHAARADLARAGSTFWGVRLDTLEWIGVDGQRLYCTRRPDTTGFTLTADSLWVGPLPKGMVPANTSVDRFGRRWAMVVLPLPADPVAARRLLIHEAMHVLQPRVLPLPNGTEPGNGAGYLDGPVGRFWLRLEIKALAAGDVNGALVFRAHRLGEAPPDERRRELALELSEGLPEYTGQKLTDSSGQRLVQALETPEAPQQSYVRRFPYLTGPAYAMFLDRVSQSWRHELTDSSDLGQMLLDATLGQKYGAGQIARDEQSRWEKRRVELAALTARYVQGPTVRIRPKTLLMSFDPRGQISLGENGNVMADVTWKTDDGAELRAPDGALVTPDWRELRVPLDAQTFAPGPLTATRHWQAAGWTLSLPTGWSVRADGTSWVVAPTDTVTPH